MKRKRIVLFTNALNPGGAERVVATLSAKLAEEYELRILLLSNDITYQLKENVRVDILGSGAASEGFSGLLRIPLLAKRLIDYCRSEEPDVVISFLSRPNFVASLAKKLGLRTKVLISERAYTPLWYRDNELRGYVGKWLTKTLYPYADAILPNSRGTADALKEIYGIDSKYFVVKNPIAIESVKAQSLEPVGDVDFGEFTFVCVARFLEQKNHELLIEAFSRVSGSPRLLLIGRGGLLDKARKQVEGLGIGERVTFVENTRNPFKYVARSQCFVLSSNFEGFPNVLLEALACGVPVISTDCLTGPRELLAPHTRPSGLAGPEICDFGILVPARDPQALADAMKVIQNDAETRNRLAAAGPVRAADYEEDLVVKEFHQIIDEFMPADAAIENSMQMNETQKRQ